MRNKLIIGSIMAIMIALASIVIFGQDSKESRVVCAPVDVSFAQVDAQLTQNRYAGCFENHVTFHDVTGQPPYATVYVY